jgi:hypothetical protein
MFRKEVSFVKQAQLAVNAAALYTFLAVPQNHLGLQPLLAEIRELREFAAADGTTSYQYTIVERLPILGQLAWYQPSRVTLTPRPAQNQITFVVYSSPGLRLDSLYQLTPQTCGTQLRETVTISVSTFLAGYVGKMAEQAHEAIFRRLRERFGVVEERLESGE